MTALLTTDRHRSTAAADDMARSRSAHPAFRPAARPTLVVIEGGRSAAAVARRRTYLVRRVAAATVLACVVGALLWGLVALGAPPATHSLGTAPDITSSHYVVRPGDSLWGIASALHRGGDVRDVVDRLAQANGSDTVYAGEAITIPSDLLH
jgi:hypothetical protein